MWAPQGSAPTPSITLLTAFARTSITATEPASLSAT